MTNSNDDEKRSFMAILTCRSCRGIEDGGSNTFQSVDDSVHVMLSKDKKKQKEKGSEHGYRPRAPMLSPEDVAATTEPSSSDGAPAAVEEKKEDDA
mmetsp:Transcript_14837/g.26913  ORF Transcript_14837/g.26913 Transcript_14837/m.26913 type:complete len:96 (+) Transcript_14837:598-885(+)|eukprot:CAMPEP_0198290104 /NCGR_PEP_ID=MMETSP1449-20131203/8079_1 /TAXON_ID=420275 /ORGANISM="Attheya septentrionalis, Strain CCMP2084" /LENGTH=95 /DNA_ID=CAMNT_0043988547 /DNA_START=568 /DNA_END=855 /DNA_ORIENTATION=-